MKTFFIKIIKNFRKLFTFWIFNQTQDFLKKIREHELQKIIKKIPPKSKILEIGGGSGWQAKILDGLGHKVSSIDIENSFYLKEKIFNVQTYDGIKIPFNNEEFDIIFSSNVLEHIKETNKYQKELYRVLKDEGLAIHIIPSATWRIWTILTDLVKSWYIPRPHGEHASSTFIEIFFFKKNWWKKRFIFNNWDILSIDVNNLFYTGNSIFGDKISIEKRILLSKILGSSCNIFILKKTKSIDNF